MAMKCETMMPWWWQQEENQRPAEHEDNTFLCTSLYAEEE